jgi:NTP-dependent ternary system trypsin peptidase co-occuring protein
VRDSDGTGPALPATGLAEAITALRRELVDAERSGRGEDIRFRIGPVELEFAVEITKEGTGEAGVRFWVLDMGAKGSVTRGDVHRVSLTLQPVSAAGGDLEISDAEAVRPR